MTAPARAAGVFEAAPAKVNLYLHVRGRRADGRHALDTFTAFAAVGDRVSARRARGLSLEVSGPFAAAIDCAADDNLVMRAARALAAAARVREGAAISLEKRLPVAAGLGGGSADAAAALRALARLWRLDMPEAALRAIAAPLGADIPACVAARPLLVSGAGEALRPAPRLPRVLPLVLVNPGVPLATAAVFGALRAPFSMPAPAPRFAGGTARFAAALARRRNDLEAPARGLEPLVGETLAALDAAPRRLLARMSGSGATCFALFRTGAEAAGAVAALRRARPARWVCVTRLLAP